MDEKRQKRERKPLSAMDRALNYLGYRMRSKREMEDYLRQKGYAHAEIADTLNRLMEYGYVDDAAFCREYLRSRLTRGAVGRRRIAFDLAKKGVEREIIDAALGGYPPEDEEENCSTLARKLASTRGTDRKAMASIQRTLASRGFGYDAIRSAIAALSEEDWD